MGALKFSRVPEGTKNLGSHWIRPRSFSSKIFNGLLFGWTLAKFKSVASPVPKNNSDYSFGLWVGLRTPNLGEEEAVWGRGWYR